MFTKFKEIDTIFQCEKRFKTDCGEVYKIDTTNKPVYKIFKETDNAWLLVGLIRARTSHGALNKYLNKGIYSNEN